jgi:hypothetical protein
MIQYLKELVFDSRFVYFSYFILVLGLLKLLQGILWLATFVNKQFLRGKISLYGKYGGEGAWVVVTGGSDGMGLEMCH